MGPVTILDLLEDADYSRLRFSSERILVLEMGRWV